MNTPLIEAIEEEDFAEAIRLLENGSDPNQVLYDEPLIIKVSECHENYEHGDEGYSQMVALIVKLAESGANLQVQDSSKKGLLHKLFSACVPLIVIDSLIDMGLEPLNTSGDIAKGSLDGLSDALANYQDADYVIAALELLERESPDKLTPDLLGKMLVDYFTHAQDNYSDFEYEHIELYPKFSDKLISMGGDINARSINGHTALMRASMNTLPNIVGYLIDKQADVDLQSNDGNTALMFACGQLAEVSDLGDSWSESPGSLDICRRLVLVNADTGIENESGQTAIDLANAHNSISTIELLS